MDQFTLDLDHGEMPMDLSDASFNISDEKYSPRRTRSGKVFDDSKMTRHQRDRRRSQQSQRSERSRNSSGKRCGEYYSDSFCFIFLVNFVFVPFNPIPL